MSTSRKVALVTGANRGIGQEVAKSLAKKGMAVAVACRDLEKGKAVVQEITKAGGEAFAVRLDVSDAATIPTACQEVLGKWGRIDVVVNNAGVFLDSHNNSSVFKASTETVLKTFKTNTLGPMLLMQTVLPHMIERGTGRVINVSSGMGQLSEMDAGYPGYRLSKTSLNALTRIFAAETKEKPGIMVNSICPGWVKTDMGGPNAQRSLEQGADTIVWLATDETVKATGQFFRDRKPMAW